MTIEKRDSSPHETKRVLILEPAKGWADLNLFELWNFRDLFVILAMRDIKLRYKQTALGIIWVILQPLAAALIFAVIFGAFAKLPSNGQPYIVFVFAGMLPWNLFAGALQRAGNSLVGDARLISKVYFPRMVIPAASAAAVVLDFLVALVVMFVLLIIYRVPFTWNLLLLPIVTLITLLLAVGVSLFFSALNVYYRDFMYVLPFLIQIWMYASPTVYATNLVPAAVRPIYALNPMVGAIDGFRWALLGVGDFPIFSLTIAVIVGLVVFFAGAFVFQRVERNFADVV